MSYCKKFAWIFCSVLLLVRGLDARGSEHDVLQSVSFENLYIDDFYWYFHFRAQRVNTLPTVWNRLIGNGLSKGRYAPGGLEDGDLYQLLETMSYISVVEPDSVQKGRMDSLAAMIPEESSGNLDFSILKKSRKSAHPRDYQLAAFYRAAEAYTRAGGQRPLLDWALKNAELLSRKVLNDPRKIRDRDLHPNMVLALGDFYQLTHNRDFLDAAQVMLRKMQTRRWGTEQGYLEAADAWLNALTGNQTALLANSLRWQSAVNKGMRITGGFSADSQTAPHNVYSLWESMADMEWCLRLYEANQDARCMELYERILYNELRIGISFYGGYVARNLQVDDNGELQRDSISEAPLEQVIPLIRNLAVLPNFYYSVQNDTAVYINQYFRGEATIKSNKLNLKLSTMSSMPWTGGFYMDILTEQPQTCTFYLRVPGWMTDECLDSIGRYRYMPMKKHMRLAVNDTNLPVTIENGFLKLSGTWKKNDRIIFNFLSSVRKIVPAQDCHSDSSALAYQRGPFLFALELADSVMRTQKDFQVDPEEGLGVSFALGFLGGVQILTGNMYQPQADTLQTHKFQLTPYFSRGQRGSSKVKIWFPCLRNEKEK